jgi:hypothetical protein
MEKTGDFVPVHGKQDEGTGEHEEDGDSDVDREGFPCGLRGQWRRGGFWLWCGDRRLFGWGDEWFYDGGGRDEAVAHTGHSLNEARAVWVIAEYVTQLPDRCIDPVFGIDKYFAGPESLCDFRACNDFSLTGDEQDQKLHWFALDPNKLAIAKQFEAAAVKLEVAELKDRIGQDAGQVTSCAREVSVSVAPKHRILDGLELYQALPRALPRGIAFCARERLAGPGAVRTAAAPQDQRGDGHEIDIQENDSAAQHASRGRIVDSEGCSAVGSGPCR